MNTSAKTKPGQNVVLLIEQIQKQLDALVASDNTLELAVSRISILLAEVPKRFEVCVGTYSFDVQRLVQSEKILKAEHDALIAKDYHGKLKAIEAKYKKLHNTYKEMSDRVDDKHTTALERSERIASILSVLQMPGVRLANDADGSSVLQTLADNARDLVMRLRFDQTNHPPTQSAPETTGTH